MAVSEGNTEEHLLALATNIVEQLCAPDQVQLPSYTNIMGGVHFRFGGVQCSAG